MAASMAMALRALGIDCTEDETADVMGVRPMRGATWEDALAAAQHYGCRATLCVPATLQQVKEWTDAGDPVLIAWNPENREWSHASVIFDVTEEHTVHVADPNIPDPDETVRVVPRKDFYSKWSEKWPRYLVRRPAMRITREITPDGRQVMAGSRKADEVSDDLLEALLTGVGDLHKIILAQDDGGKIVSEGLLSLNSFASVLREANRQAKFEKGKDMSAQDVADYLSEHGAPEAAKRWMEEHEKNKDNFDKKASPLLNADDYARLLQAKFEKGKEMSAQDVADYLSEHGAPEAAKRWMEEHEKNKDNFDKKSTSRQAKFEKGKEMSAQDVADYLSEHGAPEAAKRWMEEHEKNKNKFDKKSSRGRGRLTAHYPQGIPGVHKQAMEGRDEDVISKDLLLATFRDLAEESAADLAAVLANAKSDADVQTALRYAAELLDGFGVESINAENSWDNFFGEAVALYVNTGDTFNTTVLYDTQESMFYLTSWGVWVEKFEQQGGRVKAAHWDEIPASVEDWLTWKE